MAATAQFRGRDLRKSDLFRREDGAPDVEVGDHSLRERPAEGGARKQHGRRQITALEGGVAQLC